MRKGADGFMSNEQFKKFYWPSLKKVIIGLAENGCVPICFVEGGYNQWPEFLTEVPEGECEGTHAQSLYSGGQEVRNGSFGCAARIKGGGRFFRD